MPRPPEAEPRYVAPTRVQPGLRYVQGILSRVGARTMSTDATFRASAHRKWAELLTIVHTSALDRHPAWYALPLLAVLVSRPH